MISKDNLIGMLEECLANEDSFLQDYGKNFSEDIVKCDWLSDDDKKEIKNIVTDLLEDTERHKGIISALIEKIKGDERNEF